MSPPSFLDIPQDEFENWLTPAEALAELAPLDSVTASTIIQTAVRADLAVSGAETISLQPKDGVAQVEGRFTRIPNFYWNYVSNQAHGLGFWEGGLARFWLASSAGFAVPMTCICFNVRFRPEDIRKLKPKAPRNAAVTPITLAASLISPVPPAPVKHAGGAPVRIDWEAVMVEVASRLYTGDLKPEKQKDIEKAIIEAVLSLGDDCGEATARKHAKPLWNKIK